MQLPAPLHIIEYEIEGKSYHTLLVLVAAGARVRRLAAVGVQLLLDCFVWQRFEHRQLRLGALDQLLLRVLKLLR